MAESPNPRVTVAAAGGTGTLVPAGLLRWNLPLTLLMETLPYCYIEATQRPFNQAVRNIQPFFGAAIQI